MTGKVRFQSTLILSGTATPWHFLTVPREKVAQFGFKGNLRRVICTLNGTQTFQCSLFPNKGDYLITLNKKLRDKFGLEVGDTVAVELEKDESLYGMPMPDEFAEVLRQDAEGKRLFNKLTPGNQRLILKLIVMVSDVDKRIHRSLLAMDHLKKRDGSFNWHELNESFKLPVGEDFREM